MEYFYNYGFYIAQFTIIGILITLFYYRKTFKYSFIIYAMLLLGFGTYFFLFFDTEGKEGSELAVIGLMLAPCILLGMIFFVFAIGVDLNIYLDKKKE